jgi:AcrR family transcriptional regulator
LNGVQKMAKVAKKATTAWGDAEGRRRDILAAAKRIVETRGRDGLNMRDVAVRAKVSPGTLYVYFKTKEEIFLTLYAARVEAFAGEVEAFAAEAASWDDLFARFAKSYLAFYREYGSSLSLFSLTADPAAVAELPPALIDELRAKVVRIFALAADRARALALLEGRHLKDDPHALPLLWMVLTGLADSMSGPRRDAHPYDWDSMVRFAARTLLAGLTEESER